MSDQPTAEQLYRACDLLVQGVRTPVIRDDHTRSWISGRSLLTQLASADMAGSTGGAAGGASRSLINHAAAVVLADMATTSRHQLADLHAPDHGTDIRLNLRSATTVTALTADDNEMSAWLWLLQRWRTTARACLQLDSARRQWLRGLACPHCSATTTTHRDPGSSNMIHSSSLNIQWIAPPAALEHDDEAWTWDSVQCRNCGQRWVRGVTLSDLLRDLRAAGTIGRAS